MFQLYNALCSAVHLPVRCEANNKYILLGMKKIDLPPSAENQWAIIEIKVENSHPTEYFFSLCPIYFHTSSLQPRRIVYQE